MAKWMQPEGKGSTVVKRPGALHRALGVPEDKKIPASKLAAAKDSSSGSVRRMASLAETFKQANHNDGGQAFPDNPNAFGPAMAPNRGMPGKSAPPIGVEFKPFPRGPMVAGEGPASAPARPLPPPTSE